PDGSTVQLQGRLTGLPELRSGGWRGRMRTGSGALIQLEAAGRPPLPGQAIRLQGRLRRPGAARNPGDFDYAAYLARDGVCCILEAEDWRAWGPGRFPDRYWMIWRQALSRAWVQGLGEEK